MINTELVVRRTIKNKIGVVSLVIPRKFAIDLGISEPSNVVIKKTSEGLFIRKLEVS